MPQQATYSSSLEGLIDRVIEVADYFGLPPSLEDVALYFLPRCQISSDQLSRHLNTDPSLRSKYTVVDGCLVRRGGELQVNDRIRRRQFSEVKIQHAQQFAKLLSRVAPFVRMFAVTGSVAYGGSTESDEVDVFMIAKTNRLWIAMLLAFVLQRIQRVLAVATEPKPFCLSYVHDEIGFRSERRLKRNNAFFARELLIARPVYGGSLLDRILKEERWIEDVFGRAYVSRVDSSDHGDVGKMGENNEQMSILLDFANKLVYMILSRYLRLRAYLTNLKLEAWGKPEKVFTPTLSPASCVYTSNMYRRLQSLWSAAE